MYTLTRTPQKTQLHDSNNTLILETYHDSITAGYDSPTDTKHGSIIIPTVVTSDQHGDGIETQVKRRNGKLSSKQLTRRLLTYAYTTNTLTPGTPVQLLVFLSKPAQGNLNPHKRGGGLTPATHVCYSTDCVQPAAHTKTKEGTQRWFLGPPTPKGCVCLWAGCLDYLTGV